MLPGSCSDSGPGWESIREGLGKAAMGWELKVWGSGVEGRRAFFGFRVLGFVFGFRDWVYVEGLGFRVFGHRV